MVTGAELLIGEFAKRCRLPISTLRYYDRIGLLSPATVDDASGYRRYRADQLPTAELIARLRSLGVAPQHIAAILAGGDRRSAALLSERRRVRKELERISRHLAELDDLLAAMPADYTVTTIELTARQVAVQPFSSPFEDQEAVVLAAIGELRRAILAGGHRRIGAWGGTFPLDLDDTVEGFVFAPVDGCAGLTTMVLPGGAAVSVVHSGGLESLSLAYLALFAEIDRLGGAPQAPVIEEYLSPAETRTDRASASRPAVRLSVRLAP